MDKTTERQQLLVTQVREIEYVGEKNIPKLTFYAKLPKAEKALKYDTFRSSLFESINVDAVLDADIQISSREYEGNEYIDRRLIQIYVDGQPIGGKKQGQFYKGKSPEELDLQTRSFALSYAKDLCVADKIKVGEIIKQAEKFYPWLKGIGNERIPQDDKGNDTQPDTDEGKDTGQGSGEGTGTTHTATSSRVDSAWLKESLKDVKWGDPTVKSWLKSKYQVDTTGTVLEVVERLNDDQLKEFVAEIQDRLKMV